MATGAQHYAAAEMLLEQAADWEDADYGWKANLSTEERISRRMADTNAAAVHAMLAQAAATAAVAESGGTMRLRGYGDEAPAAAASCAAL